MNTGAAVRRAPRPGETLSRRDFLRLGGASLAGAALLAGCGGKSRTRGPVSLLFSHGPDASGVLQEQIRRFNKRHEGKIEVEFRQAPTDTGQYLDQILTEFRAGEERVDVISGDVTWATQLAARGWILDLTDRFTREERGRYLPAPVQSNIYQGRIYGVPWFTDAGMLFYRKDLLKKSDLSSPPGTWEELKMAVRRVRGDSGTKYGFVFQGAQYEGGVVDGLEFIWSAGGNVVDPHDPGEVTIGSHKAVDGLEIERSMVTDGISPEAVSSYKELESYEIFLGGDAVFMRNWPFVYGIASDPAQSEIKPEQIGVTPVPVAKSGLKSHSGLGGWNLMVNAASNNQSAAWTFIEYLSAPDQQKRRALEGGYLPTLKSLYEDKEILDKVPVMRLGKDAIKNARPRPASPYYSQMSATMAAKFHAALAGDIPPRRAASELQEQLDTLIGRSESSR